MTAVWHLIAPLLLPALVVSAAVLLAHRRRWRRHPDRALLTLIRHTERNHRG